MVKIGIANAESARHTGSSYEAVDLLDDEETGAVESRTQKRYRITDSDGKSSSSSDSLSSGDDSDLSEGSSTSSDNESGCSSNGDSSFENAVNSTATTEKHRNFMVPIKKKSTRSQLHSRNLKKENGTKSPPSSSFKHKRFQQLIMSAKKDKRGRHERLPGDENEALHSEERAITGFDRKMFVSNSKTDSRSTPFHDSLKFASRQSTDSEHGIISSIPDNYSYASADPNNIQYDPKSLRKMESVDNRAHDEKWQRLIICWGLAIAMMICVLIMIGSIVAYENRINVSPAPKNLDEICSMKSIGTDKGHKQCEKVCKEAKCCMSSGNMSCFLEQKDVCSEYAPCGTIHTNHDKRESLVVPPAPSNIEEICSDYNIATQTGFLQCQATCNPGSCCQPSTTADTESFVQGPGSPKIKPCWSTHEDVCQYYTPCESLTGLDDTHGSPVDLVNMKCTPHNLVFVEGKEDCENLCQTRACCFAESKHNNCREDNEVWCNDFSACDLLLEFPGTSGSETSSENVSMKVKCKDVENLNDEDLSICKQVCEDSTCCFYEDSKCGNHIECHFYGFCQNIVDSFPSLGNTSGSPNDHGLGELDLKTDDITIELVPNDFPTPKEVESACTDLSTSSGKDECYFRCDHYRCCFKDDYDPITCHGKQICEQFTPCKKLEELQSNDKDPMKSNVDNLCDIKNLMIGGGFDQCENICAGHLCCFNPIDEGCSQRPSCPIYESCEILMSDALLGKDADGGAEFNVDKVCSKEAITETEKRKICEVICESRSCCFGDSNKCDQDCCTNLPENQPHSIRYPKPHSNLQAVCNIHLFDEGDKDDTFYKGQCETVCKVAECCYDDTCRDVDDFCEHYVPCFGTAWDVETTSDLSVSCGDKSNAMGKAHCSSACKRWECCWESDSCFPENPGKCKEAISYCL